MRFGSGAGGQHQTVALVDVDGAEQQRGDAKQRVRGMVQREPATVALVDLGRDPHQRPRTGKVDELQAGEVEVHEPVGIAPTVRATGQQVVEQLPVGEVDLAREASAVTAVAELFYVQELDGEIIRRLGFAARSSGRPAPLRGAGRSMYGERGHAQPRFRMFPVVTPGGRRANGNGGKGPAVSLNRGFHRTHRYEDPQAWVGAGVRAADRVC